MITLKALEALAALAPPKCIAVVKYLLDKQRGGLLWDFVCDWKTKPQGLTLEFYTHGQMLKQVLRFEIERALAGIVFEVNWSRFAMRHTPAFNTEHVPIPWELLDLCNNKPILVQLRILTPINHLKSDEEKNDGDDT
jgi:hypothetical protein